MANSNRDCSQLISSPLVLMNTISTDEKIERSTTSNISRFKVQGIITI